jgi:8-oxo-dGTP diphosphatase
MKYCPKCKMELETNSDGLKACGNCKFVNYESPVAVGVSLIPQGSGLVLVLRGEEPKVGEWCLPCGFINRLEGPVKGMKRENKEETGLDTVPNRFLGFHVDLQKNLILHAFLSRVVGGSLSEATFNTDVVGVGIFTDRKRLPPIAFPVHEKLINDWFDGKFSFAEEDQVFETEWS